MYELFDKTDIKKIKIISAIDHLYSSYHNSQKQLKFQLFCVFIDSLNSEDDKDTFLKKMSKKIDNESFTKHHSFHYSYILSLTDKEFIDYIQEAEELKWAITFFYQNEGRYTLDQSLSFYCYKLIKDKCLNYEEVKTLLSLGDEFLFSSLALENKNYDNITQISNQISDFLKQDIHDDNLLELFFDAGLYINMKDDNGDNYAHECMQKHDNPAIITFLHNTYGLDIYAKNKSLQIPFNYITKSYSESEKEQIVKRIYVKYLINSETNISFTKLLETTEKQMKEFHFGEDPIFVEQYLEKDFLLGKYSVETPNYSVIEKAYCETFLTDEQFLQLYEKSDNPFQLYKGYNFLTLCLIQGRETVLSHLLGQKSVKNYIEQKMPMFGFYMIKKISNFPQLLKKHQYLLSMKDSDANTLYHVVAKNYLFEVFLQILKIRQDMFYAKNNNGVMPMDYILKNPNIEESVKQNFTSLIENTIINNILDLPAVTGNKKYKI